MRAKIALSVRAREQKKRAYVSSAFKTSLESYDIQGIPALN